MKINNDNLITYSLIFGLMGGCFYFDKVMVSRFSLLMFALIAFTVIVRTKRNVKLLLAIVAIVGFQSVIGVMFSLKSGGYFSFHFVTLVIFILAYLLSAEAVRLNSKVWFAFVSLLFVYVWYLTDISNLKIVENRTEAFVQQGDEGKWFYVYLYHSLVYKILIMTYMMYVLKLIDIKGKLVMVPFLVMIASEFILRIGVYQKRDAIVDMILIILIYIYVDNKKSKAGEGLRKIKRNMINICVVACAIGFIYAYGIFDYSFARFNIEGGIGNLDRFTEAVGVLSENPGCILLGCGAGWESDLTIGAVAHIGVINLIMYFGFMAIIAIVYVLTKVFFNEKRADVKIVIILFAVHLIIGPALHVVVGSVFVGFIMGFLIKQINVKII